MELQGKTAIITGGGRGIGRDVALALAHEKCNIVVTSRNQEEVTGVIKEAAAMGYAGLGLPYDLTIEGNIRELVEKTVERFGTVDILINSAGYAKRVPFFEETIEEFNKNLDINLKTVFSLSQKVLKIMTEKESGYIININSTVALGVPGFHTSYGASKCGLTGLSQAMYDTAKKYKVKVSNIYPGYTDTKMLRDLNTSVDPSLWLLPEDITYCILFLLKASERLIVQDIVPRAFLVETK